MTDQAKDIERTLLCSTFADTDSIADGVAALRQVPMADMDSVRAGLDALRTALND